VLTIAYLANEFPSPVEPYVQEEIDELERRGVCVVTGSVKRVRTGASDTAPCPDIVVLPLSGRILIPAIWLCVRKWIQVLPLIARVLFCGREGLVQRLKALAHTFLGACYAVQLQGKRVEHIHVHHGYFGSWIALTASKLLGIGFSLTLHGSDLLLHASYLDVKLGACGFCLTVSEYNRRYILEQYPGVVREKIIVRRMGVDVPVIAEAPRGHRRSKLRLLAVGRLHAVKDHAFLTEACKRLAARSVRFECAIAGEGPERRSLEALISKGGLGETVKLLGHVERAQMGRLYDDADVVVLTSRSEGIPLVLMEAMARARIVLAPAITGIPELVIPGKTGFLYEPGSMSDFIDQLLLIRSMIGGFDDASPEHRGEDKRLDWIRHAARVHVLLNFNRSKNLKSSADLFLNRIAPQEEGVSNENLVLQQI
jgi:colanic acid/amylovoran biosynthesis glycosyltransferase